MFGEEGWRLLGLPVRNTRNHAERQQTLPCVAHKQNLEKADARKHSSSRFEQKEAAPQLSGDSQVQGGLISNLKNRWGDREGRKKGWAFIYMTAPTLGLRAKSALSMATAGNRLSPAWTVDLENACLWKRETHYPSLCAHEMGTTSQAELRGTSWNPASCHFQSYCFTLLIFLYLFLDWCPPLFYEAGV